jgi:hypothetical protein
MVPDGGFRSAEGIMGCIFVRFTAARELIVLFLIDLNGYFLFY